MVFQLNTKLTVMKPVLGNPKEIQLTSMSTTEMLHQDMLTSLLMSLHSETKLKYGLNGVNGPWKSKKEMFKRVLDPSSELLKEPQELLLLTSDQLLDQQFLNSENSSNGLAQMRNALNQRDSLTVS